MNQIEITIPKNIYQSRIEKIVDDLMQKEEFYRDELDRDQVVDSIVEVMRKFPPDEFLSIEDENLIRRVDRMMAVRLFPQLLDGLTPEQTKIFHEMVEG